MNKELYNGAVVLYANFRFTPGEIVTDHQHNQHDVRNTEKEESEEIII